MIDYAGEKTKTYMHNAHLHGELLRWHQHNRLEHWCDRGGVHSLDFGDIRYVGSLGDAASCQHISDSQRVHKRLSAARLGRSNDVAASKRTWQGLAVRDGDVIR